MRLIQNGRLVPDLLALCRKYGINAPDDITADELNSRLQETWFKAGYLRYQIKGEPPSSEDRELLRSLGCLNAVPLPVLMFDFTGVLLLGALRSRIVSRLHYLTTVAPRPKFKSVESVLKIYLLGGARPLDPEKESSAVLCTPAELPFIPGWLAPPELPKTEAEMMAFTWKQSQLPLEWRAELGNAPLQPKPEGGTRLPNTADTVRVWLSDHEPQPGTYLAISNQPFVQYQELVLQRLVPSGFTIYACGPAASPTLPLATYLDNLAKQLYEELAASPAA
ncbi:MAG: hypothetical protein HY372_01920 [Candidatus Andersenbacteria bacterium]|nr:hypothetical protein [Candidatus Andersenbacteria bacterium]